MDPQKPYGQWTRRERVRMYRNMASRAKHRNWKSYKLKRSWPSPEWVVKDWWHDSMHCYVLKGPFGNMCGYVIVPLSHPNAMSHYDDVGIDVHGGVTYRQRVSEGTAFGFDTGHSGDYMEVPRGPGEPPYIREGKKWSIEDMTSEVEMMARDLNALEPKRAFSTVA